MLQFVVGQVFVEHGEAVAEVEIGFTRIVGREGASSHVVDDGVGDAHDFARPRPKSPAEVDLFEVGEEAGVEPACRVPIGGAHHECGAGGPKEGAHGVILPVVFFEHIEQATATEGIAEAVDESACGTGVFETVVRPFGVDLRLRGGRFGMRIHVGAHRGEPAGRGAHVAVEQEIIIVASRRFLLDAAEGCIVASGKP